MQTQIHCGGDTFNITLQRGVKQGDPLSPFIFNAVLEPLLLELEKMPGYKISNDSELSCLAFADDLMLLANDVPQAQDLLSKTETFLRNLGMQLSVQKCATFRVVPTGDSYYIDEPAIITSEGE